MPTTCVWNKLYPVISKSEIENPHNLIIDKRKKKVNEDPLNTN